MLGKVSCRVRLALFAGLSVVATVVVLVGLVLTGGGCSLVSVGEGSSLPKSVIQLN